MPLTWDLSKCVDSDALTSEDNWGKTNTFILMTMSTGIGTITEQNAGEVYARLRFLDKLYGPPMYGTNPETGERKDVSFTPEDVHALIGLKTNVFPTETRASFIRRHVKWYMKDGEYLYQKAAKAREHAEPVR